MNFFHVDPGVLSLVSCSWSLQHDGIVEQPRAKMKNSHAHKRHSLRAIQGICAAICLTALGAVAQGQDYPQKIGLRWKVVNAQTGQLTQSFTDLVVGGTVVTKDFSQNWYFNGSSYAYGPFVYCPNGDWDLYGRTDWDLASIWHGWNVLDPAVYYSQLSGAAMSPTVGGLNSTFMCQFNGAGTRNSGDDGFSITIGGNGSRMPSDVIWNTDTNQSTSTNSSALVSF